MAHIILITAYTYNCIRAGLERLPDSYEQVAASLSSAFSMGELGATIMVYPPGWVTAPVAIYALTDRGSIFTGAAVSVLLLSVTVAVLVVLNRLGRRRSRHDGTS